MAELKWLEDLLALMEENSFTQAAQRRHVTQPAFSRRIRQLEQWLDVELVDRRRKPIGILPVIRERETELRSLISQFYQLRNRLQESNQYHRTLFIVQHTLAISHFPTLVRQLLPNPQQTAYRLLTVNNEDCHELFAQQGEYMLCYELGGNTPRLVDSAGTQRQVLGIETLIPVMASQPAQQLTTISHDGAPSPLPLLLFTKGSFLADIVNNNCLPATLRDYRVDVVCESGLAISLKQMVLAGMGLAWLPAALVKAELDAGTLISLATQLGSCELDVCLYQRLPPLATTSASAPV